MHALRLLWAAHNEEVWMRRERRNISRQCLESVAEMSESLFMERFALDKNTFESLCTDLRANTSLRGTTHIPLEVKVLCTLSFLSSGCQQRIVGVTQYLPQRTTSRCIRQVIEALNTEFIINKWIKFPQNEQKRSKISREFQRKFNLPGVIGCIGCTHVAVVKPNEDEHLYYNRNGYHSLNVQIICDSNLKILDVIAEEGAKNNSSIWSSCVVEVYMRELYDNGEQAWLLGDAGYPQRAGLMTPILNAEPGSQEEIYNTRHNQAVNSIELCFNMLKARWKCLLNNQPLYYQPFVATKIIQACCVLHNIAVTANLPPPSDITEQQDADDVEEQVNPIDSSQEDIT